MQLMKALCLVNTNIMSKPTKKVGASLTDEDGQNYTMEGIKCIELFLRPLRLIVL